MNAKRYKSFKARCAKLEADFNAGVSLGVACHWHNISIKRVKFNKSGILIIRGEC